MRTFLSIASIAILAVPACRPRSFNTASGTENAAGTCAATVTAIDAIHAELKASFAQQNPSGEKIADLENAMGSLPACTDLDGGAAALAAMIRVEDAAAAEAQKRWNDEAGRTGALRLWNTMSEVRLILHSTLQQKTLSHLNSLNGPLTAAHEKVLTNFSAFPSDWSVASLTKFYDNAPGDVRRAILAMAARTCTASLQEFLWREATAAQPNPDAFEGVARCGAPEAFPHDETGGPARPGWLPPWAQRVTTPNFDTYFRTRTSNRQQLRETFRAALERAHAPDAVSLLARAFPQTDGTLRGDRVGQHQGIEVREGDVVIMRNWPAGVFFEQMTTSPVAQSHVGIVMISDDGEPWLLEQGMSSLSVSQLAKRMAGQGDFVILRREGLTDLQRTQLSRVMRQYAADMRYIYDYRFNTEDASQNYCVELAYHVYERAGLTQQWAFSSPRNAKVAENLKTLGAGFDKIGGLSLFIATPGFKVVGRFENAIPYARALDSMVSEVMVDLMANRDLNPQGIDSYRRKFVVSEVGRALNIEGSGSAGVRFLPVFLSMYEGLGGITSDLSQRPSYASRWQDFSRFRQDSDAVRDEVRAVVQEKFASYFR